MKKKLLLLLLRNSKTLGENIGETRNTDTTEIGKHNLDIVKRAKFSIK